MEKMILNRILKGSSEALNLANSSLFVNPIAKEIIAYGKEFNERFKRSPSLDEYQFHFASTETAHYISSAAALDVPESLNTEYLIYELKNHRARLTTVDQLSKLADELNYLDIEEIGNSLYKTSLDVQSFLDTSKSKLNAAKYNVNEEMIYNRRLPVGLEKFDKINGGFAQGELILLGGRRGSGKSIFALNLMLNIFEKYDGSVLFYSIEMRKHEVNNRLVSMYSGVSNSKISRNEMNDEEKMQVIRAQYRLFYEQDAEITAILAKETNPIIANDMVINLKELDKKFIIHDEPTLTLDRANFLIEQEKKNSPVPVIAACVDYINILNDPDNKGGKDSDWQIQNALAKGLKVFARNHDLIMISPMQVDATGKARFAQAIEDHIDCALKFIPNEEQKKAGILPVYIDKMRNGRDDFDFQLIMNKESLRLTSCHEEPATSVESHEEDSQ